MANRYPASCNRQEKSTSSPAERVSLKPADASKVSLRTARFPPRAYGRNPICVVAAGTGLGWARPCRDPKSKTPATRSAPSRAATMPASQPGRTTSSASQKTRISPPADADTDVASRSRPGTGGSINESDMWDTLGPLLHTGAGAVGGAVVRHDHFPFARRFLHTQGRKLLLDPRHSIEHRHDHADQRAVACFLLVRHADGFHDCCLAHRCGRSETPTTRSASPSASREHSRSTRQDRARRADQRALRTPCRRQPFACPSCEPPVVSEGHPPPSRPRSMHYAPTAGRTGAGEGPGDDRTVEAGSGTARSPRDPHALGPRQRSARRGRWPTSSTPRVCGLIASCACSPARARSGPTSHSNSPRVTRPPSASTHGLF